MKWLDQIPIHPGGELIASQYGQLMKASRVWPRWFDPKLEASLAGHVHLGHEHQTATGLHCLNTPEIHWVTGREMTARAASAKPWATYYPIECATEFPKDIRAAAISVLATDLLDASEELLRTDPCVECSVVAVLVPIGTRRSTPGLRIGPM